MHPKALTIATRKSPLALWQANYVATLLKQHWPALNIKLLPLQTKGDRFLQQSLATIGGKGLFVKELEDAILAGRADLAVHSMKDVPTSLPDGLTLASICKRHSPLDAFVSPNFANLDALPLGASIGTSSLRRQAQLLTLRPDLSIKPIRGNIQTRIDKIAAEGLDAVILAQSGLERLSLNNLIRQVLDEDLMLPACGQGALGIECRTEDANVIRLLQALNDPISALCVNTERHANAKLGGNCHTPVAILCHPVDPKQLLLKIKVCSPDGKNIIFQHGYDNLPNALQLAERLVVECFAGGAAEILKISS